MTDPNTRAYRERNAEYGAANVFQFAIADLIGRPCPTCDFPFDQHSAQEIVGCMKEAQIH
jgi:hypothetical protein